jgi:hypothetical protein
MAHRHVPYLAPAPEPVQAEARPARRELDSRYSDGVYVQLLWDPGDGQVSVFVEDGRTGDAFELPVPDGSLALDVFRHPYAYAA